MGLRQSTVEDPTSSKKQSFSDLYVACAQDDVDLARVLLHTSPFEEINTHEINGSTALHLAVQLGHADLVRLLLDEYGVCRHRTDAQGRTAFQLASTEELRQLFRRPRSDGNRFCDDQVAPGQMTFTGSAPEDLPSRRVEGHEDFLSLRRHHTDNVHAHYGSARNPSLKINNERWLIQQRDNLSGLIDPSNKSGSRIAKGLLDEYSQNGRAEPLIRLYTLPTSFYGFINRDKESSERLAVPIYNALTYFSPRAFQGVSYRGLTMSPDDLQDYRRAEEKPGGSLVINTFCSTTRNRPLAEDFARARATEGRMEVLMIFRFPIRCLTAIQLSRLSDQLPCLSQYEDEEEVLILPRTSFYVIKVQSGLPRTTIDLECSQLDREVDEYYNNLAYNISTYN